MDVYVKKTERSGMKNGGECAGVYRNEKWKVIGWV